MILPTAEAGLRRRAAHLGIGPVIFALLGFPSVISAAPRTGAPVLHEGHESQPEAAATSGTQRFELSYPTGATAGARDSLSTGNLHLELPTHDGIEKPHRVTVHDDAFRRALAEWAEPRKPLLNPFWNDPANGPPTIVRTQLQLATSEDERSWWARWHSSIWGVSASVGVLMFGMVAALSLLPRDISGWNKPNFYGLRRTFTSGPSFDYDHYYFNYLAHPYDGSEFYLVARNRDMTWWQSFLYGVAVSSTFEFVIESAYEGASWQDLWITPVSGAVIGELRWQAKKALEDPDTGKPVGTANKILYVVVDPLDAIFKL